YKNIFDAGIMDPTEDQREFQLKKNLRTEFKMRDFRTNRFGMRDKSYAVSKPKDVFRIAVVGDSYSMAAGVKEGESFHSLVEKKFNKHGKKIEILNFGVSGYGMDQYITVLKDHLWKFEPDAIIIGFCSYNDHYQEGIHTTPLKFQKPKDVNLFWKSYLYNWIKTMDYEDGLTRNQYKQSDVQFLQKKLKVIQGICDEKNVSVGLINLGITHNSHNTNKLREIFADSEIHFIDATKQFRSKKTRDYILTPLDTHPNEAGHLLLSHPFSNLVRTLRNDYLSD
ncbi:SGNH/GDSL hydrolase family protein, partial [Crocinitomicaceae bacterium]|nr:SGNH/GDSL hydrolase family protein [Crocinitomicaceae bacterium]